MAFSIQVNSQNTFQVFDFVSFYNGFSTLEALADEIKPLPEGFYRLRTNIVTTKLSEKQLNLLRGSIEMNVTVRAACDNFDRLGRVNLAFIHKDSVFDGISETTKRIEIARFITPFMDKNKKPNSVLYTFRVDNLQHIFQDRRLREQYNFWLILNIFGVPYTANKQVAGCAGRNDVFYGSLSFTTTAEPTETDTLEDDNVFIPLFMSQRFNNHSELATDVIGRTIRSIAFEVEEDLTDAHFVLITSNHGANPGGEEYIRRWHYVYLNNKEIFRYKPGRTTCEPFRVYNTQRNGIFGLEPRTDAKWQSFSNWCPGDVIDTRIINLGALPAGEHLFTIEVPDAVFVDREGNFPLSLYFQGRTSGTVVVPPSIGELSQVTEIAVGATEFDLGTLTQGDSKVISVPIKNIGELPLIIFDARTSCSCTDVAFEQDPTPSNGTLELHITHNADSNGHFDRTVAVFGNMHHSPLMIRLRGTVE